MQNTDLYCDLKFTFCFKHILTKYSSTGTSTAVSAASTRCDGDEERHHIASGGAVPQNLYTEARASQVSHAVAFPAVSHY